MRKAAIKLTYLVLPVFLAGILSAQGRGFRGDGLTPPTPAEMVQRRVAFLTKFFGLSASQVTEATNAITTEQTCLQANSTNLQTAREGLVTAIKAGNATGISGAIATLTSLQAAQETCRATAAAAIYSNLNSSQQSKVGNGLGPLMGGGGFGPPMRR